MAPAKSNSRRPQSKAFLRISLDNAYAQLGVSPLAPTAEISALINKQLAQARRRILAKATRLPDDPDEREQLRLQKIDGQIGDAKRRKVYDEANPQNVLLTVQPSALERAWARHSKAGQISEWLREEFHRSSPQTQAVFLPSPNCQRLWTPSGIDENILLFLADCIAAAPAPDASAEATIAADPEGPLTIHDLEQILAKE